MCRVAIRRPSSVLPDTQDVRHEQGEHSDADRAQRFGALLTHLTSDEPTQAHAKSGRAWGADALIRA